MTNRVRCQHFSWHAWPVIQMDSSVAFTKYMCMQLHVYMPFWCGESFSVHLLLVLPIAFGGVGYLLWWHMWKGQLVDVDRLSSICMYNLSCYSMVSGYGISIWGEGLIRLCVCRCEVCTLYAPSRSVSSTYIASLHHSSVWIIANLDSDIVHVDMEQQVQSSKH